MFKNKLSSLSKFLPTATPDSHATMSQRHRCSSALLDGHPQRKPVTQAEEPKYCEGIAEEHA